MKIDLAERDTGQRVAVRRAYATKFEVRASKKGGPLVDITGHASAYDQPYEMWDWLGSYVEVVRAGAGKKTLSENPQTQLLLNHGGLSMAYTRAGTLALTEDDYGLAIEAEVNTKRSDVADMVQALEDGAVDEMSFAFEIIRQQWSPDYMQRDIIEYSINRGDVSVVNFGANPATGVEVAARGLDIDRMSETAAMALYARLAGRFAPAPVPFPDGSAVGQSLSLARAQLALLD